MKQITSICFLFLVIFSCSKKDSLIKIDCPTPSSATQAICNGTICQSDTCNTYFGIWKELFLSKSQMTENYFNNHISICNTLVKKIIDKGFIFKVDYKITVDWFEVTFYDNFSIWLYPEYVQKNPSVNLPSNILLSKDQISSNRTNSDYFIAMTFVPIDHLKYSSRQEAINAMALAAGANDMCYSYLNIQFQGEEPYFPSGHPLLIATATLNRSKDQCVLGTMDLATGDINIKTLSCMIWF